MASGLHLGTGRADFRIARELGSGWYFKGVGGYYESDDFTVSRDETVEYSVPCPAGETTDCLALEAEPLIGDRIEKPTLGLRFDKDVTEAREPGTI